MAVTPPSAGGADPAVQPTTLPGWRQFVAVVPSVPVLLPGQEWLSLEDGKRAAHDEERLEHHSRLVVVQTPVIGRIIKRGGDLVRMNRLAITGGPGSWCPGRPGPGRPRDDRQPALAHPRRRLPGNPQRHREAHQEEP